MYVHQEFKFQHLGFHLRARGIMYEARYSQIRTLRYM